MDEAPELAVDGWINGEASLDRDGPVLLHFWTSTSVECVRSASAVQDLNDHYDDLTVIGVHSPEFSFEAERAVVERAVDDLGIGFPVALDHDNTTWERYGNRYWPRQAVVVDGRIRHENVGEGGHGGVEAEIRRHLADPGERLFDPAEDPFANLDDGFVSPDVYAGAARSRGLGNPQTYTAHTCVDFTDPGEHELHRIYLDGEWVQAAEHLRTAADGRLALRFAGSEVHAVLAADEPTEVAVRVDGEPVDSGDVADGAVTVDRPGLYHLLDRGEGGISELELEPAAPDVQVYRFSFA